MAGNIPSVDHAGWYRGQVVFLTGGTGGLGGCLLYKLAVQLPTEKIYVLCRGSVRQAMEKWETSMPEQIDDIFDSGKVHCLIGDVTQPEFGLELTDLEKLQRDVTVVIHGAATISFLEELPTSIRNNCLPVKTLSRMLFKFTRLRMLLHISSITVNTFLPGGSVTERIHCLSDDEDAPDAQVESILETGHSPHTDRFPATYAQAKYLSERVLLDLNTPFPILVVRPSSISPAIQDPYPFYGPDGAIPGHSFLHLLLKSKDYQPHIIARNLSQDMIMDEIPVDLVANTCLLHIACGTTGIVHACSQLHVSYSLSELAAKCYQYTPKSLFQQIAKANFEQNGAMARHVADTFQRTHRNWVFNCRRSEHLRGTTGPIGLSVPDHDPDQFLRVRVERQSRLMAQHMSTATRDLSL